MGDDRTRFARRATRERRGAHDSASFALRAVRSEYSIVRLLLARTGPSGEAHAKGMTSHLQIQLIDGGNIDLMLVYAPFEPQMNSGDFREPAGEQTLGNYIADDLGAKPPTAA